MSQERYFDWKDPDSSNHVNRKYLGIIPKGVYRGFDDASGSSGTTLVLAHTNTGYFDTSVDGDIEGPKGIVITRQGVSTIEDEDISIEVTGNSDGNPRIDLIVLEHAYFEVDGGVSASYQVIEGTPAPNPVPPALTDDRYQVIIGTLTWPANESIVQNATWERAATPALAESTDYVFTTGDQSISGVKSFDAVTSKTIGTTSATISRTSNELVSLTAAATVYSLANESGGWLAINKITIPGATTGRLIILHTAQNLMLNASVSGEIADAGSFSNSPFYVRANTSLLLLRKSGSWQILCAEDGGYARPRQEFGMHMYRAVNIVFDSDGIEEASINGDGDLKMPPFANMGRITASAGNLRSIKSFSSYGNVTREFGTPNSAPNGPVVYLRTAAPLTLYLDASVPGGYGKIMMGNATGSLYIDRNALIQLVEVDSGYFHIVSICDQYNNTSAFGRDVTSLITFATGWTPVAIGDGTQPAFKAYIKSGWLYLTGNVAGEDGAAPLMFTLDSSVAPLHNSKIPLFFQKGSDTPGIIPAEIMGFNEVGAGEASILNSYTGGAAYTVSFTGLGPIKVVIA